jgi:hypothetical protein
MSALGERYVGGLRAALIALQKGLWAESQQLLAEGDRMLAEARARGAWLEEGELRAAHALCEECLSLASGRRDYVRDEIKQAGQRRTGLAAYGLLPWKRR